MIQLRQIQKNDDIDNNEMEELAKVLNFLGDNNIEHDLNPPVVHDGIIILDNGKVEVIKTRKVIY